MQTENVAFEKGRLAASEGQTLDENPYFSDTKDFRLWAEGFTSVKKENEDSDIAGTA